MKKIFMGAVIFSLCLLALMGCSKKPSLHVYNWTDYMNPDVISRFEQQYNCSVVVNYFDSNDTLYAKLKSGASGYDVAFPSSYMAKVMYQQGILQKIDHSKLQNLKNIDADYISKSPDSKMEYSIPYMISYCGIAYNKAQMKNFRPTWAMFDRADYPGRTTLLNEGREVIGAALKFHGYSYNSTDPAQIKKAGDTVIRWNKNQAKFSMEDAKDGLASGDFFMIQAYNGDVLQIIEKNDNIGFAFPVEGTSIAQDNFVIPADAKNVDLAYKFIDFLLDAENARDNMSFVSYMSPNTAAQKLMSKDFMNNPAIMPPPEILAKCEHILDLGADNKKYSELWDSIKSSK